jgi:N-acetylneuraminate synthase/N,N'-diacetyllegionaminate synthase
MARNWPQSVQIGGRAVGPDEPLFVIAEAGVNHDGRLDRALQMIRSAADAGADAVKFQAFSAQGLVTAGAPSAGYQQASSDQRALLGELELSPLELAQAKAECESLGLTFLATPFGPRDVADLFAMGVAAIKIASPDVANPPLLRVAAETHLPIILSTGASTLAEVTAAADTLADAGCEQLVLLHCVSSYPTEPGDCNLRTIRTLADAVGAPVGFSDHTTGAETGALAVAAGACLLEKHFTLSRGGGPSPDHFFSLEPAELGDYVASARHAQRMMGHGRREPADAEADVRAVARSSVVSAVAIPAGTPIRPDMLAVKRPGGGIEPGRIDELVGRTAGRDIPPDTTLRWEMLR